MDLTGLTSVMATFDPAWTRSELRDWYYQVCQERYRLEIALAQAMAPHLAQARTLFWQRWAALDPYVPGPVTRAFPSVEREWAPAFPLRPASEVVGDVARLYAQREAVAHRLANPVDSGAPPLGDGIPDRSQTAV
jgi:hypothetical protein